MTVTAPPTATSRMRYRIGVLRVIVVGAVAVTVAIIITTTALVLTGAL